MKRIVLFFFLALSPLLLQGQEVFDLNKCLHYALENNESLQKDRISLKQAALSRSEVVGALLPQLSGSGSFTYNMQKTAVAMPNFMKSMMPSTQELPDYLVVEMGMDFSPNIGASLAQQVLNFSLFNAVKIADNAKEMAQTGLVLSTEEVISQTAALYYGIQVLEYALGRFGEVIDLMDRTLEVMKINREAELMRDIDVKRIMVSKTNMETERTSVTAALEVQKRLLKLQMGFPMEKEIGVYPLNEDEIVAMVYDNNHPAFDVTVLPAFKMMKSQQEMLNLQYKSAVYANLPVLALVGTYSMNYMWNNKVTDSFHSSPMSMVSLSLKVPIFTGGSNRAKVQKAKLEVEKSLRDEKSLVQALSMKYSNSRMMLDKQLKTVESQIENKSLALEVYRMTESNFNEGIAPLTDVLSTSSSMIQAEMNFATALNDCIQSYIDLKVAEGTINEMVK